MSFDPTTSPLLTAINVADTPSYELEASSNVIGSSTYNTDVVWGGPGGTFQVITTGNLASIAQIASRGLLAIKTVGSGVVTALITEGNGISVEESGNDFVVSVIANSTTQLVTGQCNGDTANSPKNIINLVAGTNVAISLSESSDALNYTINASGGGGGDASTWSEFPATQDVDMDGFEIVGLTSLQVTTDAGLGKVLTSDVSGNATWEILVPTPPSLSITTVDDTPTNIEIIEVLAGDCVTVTGNVVGLDDASTDACGGNFSITAFQLSGVVTLVSPPVAILSTTSTATFNVSVDAGSGFIILTVTGLVDTNYNWKINYNVLNLNA